MTTNDEDRKIVALRAAAHDQGAADPRWDALAEGRLSGDEVAALRDDASKTEEGRAMWDLHRPLDRAEKGRLLDGVRDRIRREKARSQRRRGILASFSFAAAAAMMLLYFHNPPVEARFSPSLGAGSQVLAMSAPDEPAGIPIMPVEPRKDPLTLRGSLLLKGDTSYDWAPGEANLKHSAENVLYLSGTRRELFPCFGPGDWVMVLAVGPKGKMLSREDLLASKVALRGTVRLTGPAVAPAGKTCPESTP